MRCPEWARNIATLFERLCIELDDTEIRTENPEEIKHFR